MAFVAVLGYGVVGSGAVKALTDNAEIIKQRVGEPIIVKRILDLRDFTDDPLAAKFTKLFEDIENDSEICAVAEAFGGLEPAYSFTKRLLLKGKSVVTSNKELVASHGAELLAIAHANGANYMFEGSVCGGIPLIRTITTSLTADRVLSVAGIMNGTTNYILTQMANGGDYAAALAEAQDLGYAERDPSDDVHAKDPCRKLAILLSLFTGKLVDYNNIHTEGITHLTADDILYAKELSGLIKLVAYADLAIPSGAVSARVTPAIVSTGHPLFSVNGVFNAVYLNCDITGEVMLYGRGAGKLPTGGAVAADLIDAVKMRNHPATPVWNDAAMPIQPAGQMMLQKLIRVGYTDKIAAADLIQANFNVERFVEIGKAGEIGFVTKTMPAADIDAGISTLNTAGHKILNQIVVI